MTASSQRNPYRSIVNTRVVLPLLVAAVLRFGLMFSAFKRTGIAVMTQGDTPSYLEPGRNLWMHGIYASNGLPEIDRTPGYPIFLMLSGMLHDNVLLSVSVQILISLLSLMLLNRISARIFHCENAGLIAAWLYAIEPISIMYSVRLMPETVFVCLLLIAIDRLHAFLSTSRLVMLCPAALALAATTYVRPVSYYLVPALALGLAIVAPRGKGLRWKSPSLLLLVAMPILAAWQLRNYVETGYSGFSSIVEKNLYFYQSAELTAELEHITLAEQQRRLGYLNEASYLTLHPEQLSWTQAQQFQYMHVKALEILSNHPILYAKSHIAGVGIVAFTPCASELLQLLGVYPSNSMMPRRLLNEGIAGSIIRVIKRYPRVAITMAVLELLLCLLYLFASIGLGTVKAERTAIIMIVCIALYFLLISGGAQAVGRYRLPVMPELCVLAGGGVACLIAKQRRGHNGPAGATS